eukprot:4867447-Amphidinium_carterae.1
MSALLFLKDTPVSHCELRNTTVLHKRTFKELLSKSSSFAPEERAWNTRSVVPWLQSCRAAMAHSGRCSQVLSDVLLWIRLRRADLQSHSFWSTENAFCFLFH